ncbi:TrkH family potassium uptake protein [Ferrimonas aestuarii]|uniref:Trk system potassium uptake protein n=1 Tax=Ferrimonas aestuarii TaxID=2569539 RepID=A0A4U1BM38_9GAMM|nr:TrkH family potassium uptake protein [Ferrimonas aestuarii]TKB51912.1 TrkH family potassium uptake protein [Ferrimonas aestuarii]
MINLRPLTFLLGLFLAAVALLMWVPAGVSLYHNEGLTADFIKASLFTFTAAAIAISGGQRSQIKLSTRDLYLFTTFTWVVVSIFAALPFTFYHGITYTDAFFETMSGITTTGSTVLSGLDNTAWSILIWRSLLQWVGGIGFIVMGVAIFPMLNVGGMRLFRTESSDWSDKWLPRTHLIGRELVKVYLLLTALCCLGYLLSGMTPFEAINHAMTTLSTGGYSTTDSSMTNFSTGAHWNGTLFMWLGGLPMLLFVQMKHMRSIKVWNDQQVKGYLLFTVCAALGLGVWLSSAQDMPLFEALTLASFNLVSVITTTGFASTDYSAWGPAFAMVFLFLMFVGGCSGSTSGAVKIFRFQLAFTILKKALRLQIHPNAVIAARYNRRVISEDIVRSLISFTLLLMATIVVVSILLVAMGVDPITSFTGAITTVTNVGPGLGEVIGPAGNFATLPDGAKWLLAFSMLLGRLEIITIAVLLLPAFWRY